jgi:universal stress protein E
MNADTSAIMVAIATLDRSSQPLLKKAAGIARQRDSALHVVHVIAMPFAPPMQVGGDVAEASRASVRDSERRLAQLVKSAGLRNLDVQTTVVWDYPASDAIVRQVFAHRPALLVIESQRHHRLARMVLSNTDWDLIRHCPCPLLISKRKMQSARPQVIAALDPYHSRAKPARLDAEILKAAVAYAGSANRVTAFHSYALPMLVEGSHEPYLPILTPEELAEHEKSLAKTVRKSTARYEIPEENVVLMRGDVGQTLPRLVKRTPADLVAMGAVSRSGLKRLFIGNTAERLIDKLDCDVLIVKPPGFKSPVPRRPVRLLPYPPYPL